jgi:hypothetical protein
MAKLLRLADYRRPRGRVFFNRSELRKLLAVYSERVARGEWRDYAIDQRSDMVAFAVFRSSYDWPLYVIAKLAAGDRRPGRWVVSAGRERVIQGRDIDEVLSVFNETPETA